MIELDADLPAELAPLAWLIGEWEGTGVIHYSLGDETLQLEVAQRVTFSHDGVGYLTYSSTSWRGGIDDPQDRVAHTSESGYWRLSRPIAAGEPGPAMLPGVGEPPVVSRESVEGMREPSGAFPLEVTIAHPDGISELYLGSVAGARIDLATDAVMRSATAKPYAAATRIYGLVESRLLWAWDIAAYGQGLASHASGSLDRVR